MGWLQIKNFKIQGWRLPSYQFEAIKFVAEIEKHCECLVVNNKGNEQAELIELYEYKDGTRFRLSYAKKDDIVPHIEAKLACENEYDYIY